jgi:hypothetical protein
VLVQPGLVVLQPGQQKHRSLLFGTHQSVLFGGARRSGATPISKPFPHTYQTLAAFTLAASTALARCLQQGLRSGRSSVRPNHTHSRRTAMLIKDLSACADLDAASMTAVRGGQANPAPGPVHPQDFPDPLNPGVNPPVVISTYNYHDYYHPFPTFKR